MPQPFTHVPEHLCHLCGRYVPRRLDDAQLELAPLSVDRLTLPQIYGQISPRLMRPPCLRAKNARFPARFARKPGGDELQACADDQLRQLSPLSPCGADGAKT